MYIGPKPDGIGADLRLAHIDHRAFDGLGTFNDLDRTYFGHLWELFGLRWEDAYLAGRRTTFHDMTGPMLGRLGPFAAGLDAAVIASSTPDAEPGFPLPFLELALDGIDTVFAIADQGAAGAFTALRLTATTLPAGSHGRALVLVMDQATVLPGPPIPEDIRPTRDMAVALVLDRAGARGVPRVRQHAGVSTSDIVTLLRAEVEEAGAGAVTAICRPDFAPYWAKADVSADILPVPAGLPCTGPWVTLSEHCADLAEPPDRKIVLADYDPRLGYLSLCRLDTAAT
ncbi:hypothetical protein AB0C07_11980 [Actinoplanes missouriensis]|uniref:hypothetical protein n=1 Tax=Actinoplanes missouriensis TaxID=1866 RepID=UPI0033D00114